MNLHFPFPISIGSHFMEHEEDIADPIFLILDSQKMLRYVMHILLLINIHVSSSMGRFLAA
jgi:hypothetical protein